nr:MAG TPA: hypothetical protein [Caudoviricetes sp.]
MLIQPIRSKSHLQTYNPFHMPHKPQLPERTLLIPSQLHHGQH